jgi:hypothetical protein
MRPTTLATFFGLLLAAVFAPGESRSQESDRRETADLATTDSESFLSDLRQADRTRQEPQELRRLLERCRGELGRAPVDVVPDDEAEDVESRRAEWMREYHCAQVADELASRGDDQDREALWQVFDDPDTNGEIREGIVRGVLRRRLEEAAGEEKNGAPVARSSAFDPRLLRVPAQHAELVRSNEQSQAARAAKLPAELRDAWRTVSSAQGAYLRLGLGLAGDTPSSYIADSSGFYQQVSEYLRGRASAAEAVRRIGRFEWGSWCGMGSQGFHEPRDRALLLALIDLGEGELATGALLDVAGGEWPAAGSGAEDEPRRPLWHQLAGRLGHDWEQLAIGSLLLGDRARGAEVAEHGTERGARLLLRALEQAAPHDENALLGDHHLSLSALAALVTGTDGCDGSATSSLDDQERHAGELPGDVQLDALEAIAGRATDEAGLDLASEATRQLHRLCRRESLPVFEGLARSRFSAVRVEAAKARRALTGAEIEVTAAPPVTFVVRVDGAPWRGSVEWATSSRGGSTSETRPLDAEGRLDLDRDLFVDPKAPVRSVRVGTKLLEGAADTWFVARVKAPRTLSAATEIAVDTRELTIVLPLSHAGSCRDAGCRVSLEAETEFDSVFPDDGDGEPENRYFQAITEERPLRVGEELSLRVVRGLRYRAIVEARGASWTSPVVEPGARPAMLELRGDLLLSFEEQYEALVEGSR